MKKEINSVIAIVIILIISILFIGVITFIVSKNDLSKSKDNNMPDNKLENNDVKEETYPKIENLDAIAKDFYDNFISSNSLLFFNYNNVFKNENKFNAADLTFDERMSIVYSYVYSKNYKFSEVNNNFEVSADEFKNYYIKLFLENGYDSKKFKSEFYYCHGNGEIKYDNNSNKFIDKTTPAGCGSGPYGEKYLYDKAEQVNDQIKLYIKVGYTIPDTSGTIVDASKIILYSDYDRKNIIASNIDINDISQYKEQLNTLIYTLIKDTNTNNYVLESIEVVK